jgi:Zn-dependent protease with chaperone function
LFRLNGATHGFVAELFHPGLGNEVVRGKIYVEPNQLAFRSDDTTYDIPWDQLLVELGEEDGRIYFRNRADADLRMFTEEAGILEVPGFGPAGTLRQQLERTASRRELGRRLRLIGYVVAACFGLGWLGVQATHFMVRSLVAKVPPKWEQQFGDERIAELKNEGALLDDSNRVAKLTALLAPLLQVIPHGTEFKFHIADSKAANAFALPGGHIVVNSGLLEIASNNELFGVIAHESAHITQNHHARKIISAAGPVIIFGMFLHSRNGLVNVVGRGSELMLTQGFSQEYETEADETGWNYLVQANIDPRGMISMFQKFKAEDNKETSAFKLPQAFQSHPALDKRIARLEAKWKQLRQPSDFLEVPAVDLRKP